MTNVYALQFPSFSTKEKLLAGLFDVNNIVIVKIKALPTAVCQQYEKRTLDILEMMDMTNVVNFKK